MIVYFQLVIPVVLVLARGGSSAAESLCLVGDFDSQAQQLLSSQLMTRDELANLSAVFHSLQETLQMEWPGSEVIPAGSITTGLMMKWSDADCMVKVPYYNIYNVTASRHLIQTAVNLLSRYPEMYHNVQAKYRKKNKIDLLKFTYLPTERDCDVNFISTAAVDASRMIATYYSLDNRVFTLAGIIKIWAAVYQRTSMYSLTSYALNLLIIFYLQQEQIVPSYYLLQRSDSQYPESNMDTNHTHNSKNVYQLLGGFFKYYSEFNFGEYVASPVVGRVITKKQFEDVDSLPDELSSYKIYKKNPNSKAIDLNKTLCVQDVLFQHINAAEATKYIDAVLFLNEIKSAARSFELIPEEHFLTAILTRYRYGGDVNSNTIAEVAEVQDCIDSLHMNK